MKDVLRSAAMAFLMFSVIPMPRVEWKKENMRYMLCCLPLGSQFGIIGFGCTKPDRGCLFRFDLV